MVSDTTDDILSFLTRDGVVRDRSCFTFYHLLLVILAISHYVFRRFRGGVSLERKSLLPSLRTPLKLVFVGIDGSRDLMHLVG